MRDLFGVMPVRVKQRSRDAEKSGYAKDFDKLVLEVVALVLFRAGHTSVEIRDLSDSRKVSLNTWKHTVHDGERLPMPERMRKLLGQASLVDRYSSECFTTVEATGLGIKVYGTVCLIPTATKRLQFIALGHVPLQNDHSSNELYEEVNRVFADSAFGALEGKTVDQVTDHQGKEHLSLRLRDLRAKKGVDRWPIFALQIHLAQPGRCTLMEDATDSLNGRASNLADVTNLLRVLAFQWLKKHHFRPRPFSTILQGGHWEGKSADMPATTANRDSSPPNRALKRSRRNMSTVLSGTRSPSSTPVQGRRLDSPFDSWSRVKMGQPLTVTKHDIPNFATLSRLEQPLLDERGKLIRKPFDETAVPKPTVSLPNPGHNMEMGNESGSLPQDDTIVWINPTTMTRSTINGRTGFMVETDSLLGNRITLPPSGETSKDGKAEPAQWIQEMLSTWQNPAFAPVEPSITRISGHSGAFDAHARRVAGGCTHASLGTGDHVPTEHLQERISRVALRKAQVIAQVDAKFILVRVTPQAQQVCADDNLTGTIPGGENRELLLLIDQHAADERCKVEVLQKSYFSRSDGRPGSWTPVIELLDKPILFEVDAQDAVLLVRYQQHLKSWGVEYTVHAEVSGLGAMVQQRAKPKVQINGLPPSILERCRLEPRVLIELVRKEVWRLRDDPGTLISPQRREVTSENDLEDGKGWVSRFHGCPPGILELINSRACRSAIMFNDHLSVEQCEDLVLRLAACAFPFQCAHGRPSMAPLLDLGSCDEFGYALEGERQGERLLEKLRKQMPVDSNLR